MDQSEVLKFENGLQITKLSQAIRIGAKLRPQCTGTLFRGGGSCAIGAAYEGATGMTTWQYGIVFKLFPELSLKDFREPTPSTLAAEIMEKNDGDGWTREQIADWLESQGY